MRAAIVVLGLGSVILLSMGFLALSIIINRQMKKEAEPRRRSDDDE